MSRIEGRSGSHGVEGAEGRSVSAYEVIRDQEMRYRDALAAMYMERGASMPRALQLANEKIANLNRIAEANRPPGFIDALINTHIPLPEGYTVERRVGSPILNWSQTNQTEREFEQSNAGDFDPHS